MQTSELNYFKEMLEDRKKQIVKNIDGVYKELDELSSCELNDEGDHASVSSSSMLESQLVGKLQEERIKIDYALSKIASGEYGTCAMCEEPVGFQRLKVKPHAIYCIHCREIIEKTDNSVGQ